MGRDQELSSRPPSALPWLGATLAAQIGGRALLYPLFYGGAAFFCGDANAYHALASGGSVAYGGILPAYPLVLGWFLPWLGSAGAVVAFQSVFGILAHALLFLALLRLSPERPRRAFLLSSFALLNPYSLRLESFAFVADGFALGLIGLFGWAALGSFSGAPRARRVRLALATAALSVLSVTKLAFLHWCPVVYALYLAFWLARTPEGAAKRRAALAILPAMLLFLAGPASYSVLSLKPKSGRYLPEQGGGMFTLVSLTRTLSCDQLLDAIPDAQERAAAREACKPEVLALDYFTNIWDTRGLIGRLDRALAAAGIGSAYDRDSIYRRWSRSLVLTHPQVLLSRVAEILDFHVLGDSWPLRFDFDSRLHSGCENLPRRFIAGGDPARFEQAWRDQLARSAGALRPLEALANTWILIQHAGEALLLFFFPILAWRRRPGRDAAFFYLLALSYFGVVSIGAGYDMRYYVPLSWMCALVAGFLLASPRGSRA